MPLDVVGDRDILRGVWSDSLRRATLLSWPIRSPGKPSEGSLRYIGVAVGSIETADRMGKTRSIEPGLRADPGSSDPMEGVGDLG